MFSSEPCDNVYILSSYTHVCTYIHIYMHILYMEVLCIFGNVLQPFCATINFSTYFISDPEN